MSDYNRGAYTPPNADAPLTFDARRPVRGGSPAPVTLIISALVLVVLIAGAWFIYRDGFRGKGDAPQVVGTAVPAIKTAPKVEDQPKDETQGLQIYNQTDGLPPADPTYAPSAEEPLPRPAPPVVAPRPQPSVPVASNSLPPVASPGLPKNTPPATPAPPKVAPAPPAPVVAKTPPAVPASTPAKASGYLVQIGAFSSAGLADKGWSDAAAISPGAAAGKGKKVETVDSNGKTLYRTSVTGFASRADAVAFCDRLKAAGKSCFVR
jgi:cell division protein FtsN